MHEQNKQSNKYQVVDTQSMTIAGWEQLKRQYEAKGYTYAPSLLTFVREDGDQQTGPAEVGGLAPSAG